MFRCEQWPRSRGRSVRAGPHRAAQCAAARAERGGENRGGEAASSPPGGGIRKNPKPPATQIRHAPAAAPPRRPRCRSARGALLSFSAAPSLPASPPRPVPRMPGCDALWNRGTGGAELLLQPPSRTAGQLPPSGGDPFCPRQLRAGLKWLKERTLNHSRGGAG